MRPEQARGSIGIIFDQPESAFPFSHRFGGSAGQENGGRHRGDSPARRRATVLRIIAKRGTFALGLAGLAAVAPPLSCLCHRTSHMVS